MVAGDAAMEVFAATTLYPTGWAVSMCSATTASKIAALRGANSLEDDWVGWELRRDMLLLIGTRFY